MNDARGPIEAIVESVEQVILGKAGVVRLALAAMLAGGHILIEDVPGVGKTRLARSLATSLGCSFGRIQFTPDLLPSDVTGIYYYDQKENDFQFRRGPILSQVVLADEINRATPRTQSSLLEGMAEGQVTVEGITKRLPRPFVVMATQNPIDYEGTFPLPEAQLDRFMIRIDLGYPNREDESEIVKAHQYADPLDRQEAVVPAEVFLELQEAAGGIFVKDMLTDYMVSIVEATRNHGDVMLGSSPRGSIALFKMSQAWALIHGRDYVIPDDIKAIATWVLNHRLILEHEARVKKREPRGVLREILGSTEVPLGEFDHD